MNRNTLASTLQAVEQLNRLFVFQEVCLAAPVLSNPIIGRGDAIPTKRDNQDIGGEHRENHANCYELSFARHFGWRGLAAERSAHRWRPTGSVGIIN